MAQNCAAGHRVMSWLSVLQSRLWHEVIRFAAIQDYCLSGVRDGGGVRGNSARGDYRNPIFNFKRTQRFKQFSLYEHFDVHFSFWYFVCFRQQLTQIFRACVFVLWWVEIAGVFFIVITLQSFLLLLRFPFDYKIAFNMYFAVQQQSGNFLWEHLSRVAPSARKDNRFQVTAA